MNASRYIYSTPKKRAKTVKNKTSAEAVRAKLSEQNDKCESKSSKKDNHRPKSINV